MKWSVTCGARDLITYHVYNHGICQKLLYSQWIYLLVVQSANLSAIVGANLSCPAPSCPGQQVQAIRVPAVGPRDKERQGSSLQNEIYPQTKRLLAGIVR